MTKTECSEMHVVKLKVRVGLDGKIQAYRSLPQPLLAHVLEAQSGGSTDDFANGFMDGIV